MFHLDESKAKDYVGKTILLCVSYVDHEEVQTGQMQWFGRITEVSNARGIIIALRNDSTHCALPPALFHVTGGPLPQVALCAAGSVARDWERVRLLITRHPVDFSPRPYSSRQVFS